MSTNTTSGQTESGGADSAEENKDTVAYDTYKKVLSEKKKRDQELSEAKARLAELESKELEAKGEQAKLIEALRKENTDLKKSSQTNTKQYAWNTVSSQIKLVATQMGCQDSDALIKLGEWSTIEVKDDFSVDETEVKRALGDAQKKYPYLFKKTASGAKDAAPNNRNPGTGEQKKSLAKMTVDELRDQYRNLRTKEGYK